MELLIVVVLIIVSIVLLGIILGFNFKKAKSLQEDKTLEKLINKFPDNITVAKEMLKSLNNEKVKVEEKVKEQVKSTVLPKDRVKKSNESNKQSKPCTRAWVYAGDVYRSYRLTIENRLLLYKKIIRVLCVILKLMQRK